MLSGILFLPILGLDTDVSVSCSFAPHKHVHSKLCRTRGEVPRPGSHKAHAVLPGRWDQLTQFRS